MNEMNMMVPPKCPKCNVGTLGYPGRFCGPGQRAPGCFDDSEHFHLQCPSCGYNKTRKA